ncbi:hypothetical protein UN63_14630 [Oceanisphaera arctica]|uniref:Transposase n=1 Tax=Oceanisphaera arctica TaxID=641510 RepID=A0A2P5TIV8_9GAMM|nr:hypothetical protein UN63_14630 [Oceanisphaera arctica]
MASQFQKRSVLKILGVAIGYCLKKSGKQSLEYRYCISSAELDKTRFAAFRHVAFNLLSAKIIFKVGINRKKKRAGRITTTYREYLWGKGMRNLALSLNAIRGR